MMENPVKCPDWPPVLVHRDNRVVLRDGMAMVFFLKQESLAARRDIALAIEDYCNETGMSALKYFVDQDGNCPPLGGEGAHDTFCALLEPDPEATEVSLTLLSDEDGVPEHEVHYFALCHPDHRWPDFRDYMYFWLPRKSLDGGADRIFELFCKIASKLPVVSGYASPAFLYHHDIGEATRRCSRWPGLDVLLTRTAAMEIGNSVAGTYWATVVANQIGDRLGGAAAMRSALPATAVVTESPAGLTYIRLGRCPKSGDRNRGQGISESMPEYQALARLLSPVVFTPKRNYFTDADNNPDPDSMVKWHHRFD